MQQIIVLNAPQAALVILVYPAISAIHAHPATTLTVLSALTPQLVDARNANKIITSLTKRRVLFVQTPIRFEFTQPPEILANHVLIIVSIVKGRATAMSVKLVIKFFWTTKPALNAQIPINL